MELKNFYAQDDAGNVLSEATCYLYERGSETLVEALRGANGLALANPFVSDEQGLVQFAAPNGLYDLRVVKGGRDSRLRMQCNDVTETEAIAENAARALEEKLANAVDPSYGAGKLPAVRWPLHIAIANGMQSMLSALPRSIWELAPLVTNRPGATEPWNWDWLPALQALSDAGGAWYLPDNKGTLAIYKTSRHVQSRYNRALTIFGPPGNRPRAQIRTTPNFTDTSIFRQWDSTWYVVGENNPNERPANLAPYAGSIDRYLNIRNIEFYVDSDAGGEVTGIDLVALQETSYFEGLVFNGPSTIEKGWPIRMRTGGGSEVSMNGASIRNVTVYGQKWRGELFCKGSGSDLDVDTWVTSNAVHKESPFQTSMIDVTLRNLHSEAYCEGQPTFKSEGQGLTVAQSFVVVRDKQGDIFDSTGLITLSQITLYPAGGLTTNVTNRATINAIKDSSGGTSDSAVRLLKYVPMNMGSIARIISYSRDNVTYLDSNGVSVNISPSSANMPVQANGACTADSPFVIPYKLRGAIDPIHFCEVTLFGRKVSTGNAVILRVRLIQSNNFTGPAGYAPRTAVILENTGWPADVAVTLNGEYFTVTTADPAGVVNIKATGHGAIYFNAVNS